jgi:transcription initiation factor IIE alpha subunit
MPSRHKVPYCQGKIKYSQDDIKNMHEEFRCPCCGVVITNMDVADTLQLVDCVSLIKASGSKLNIF